jgi:hypothetical protein
MARPRSADPKVQIRLRKSTITAAERMAQDGESAGDVIDRKMKGTSPPPSNGTPSVVPSASTEKAKPDPAALHPALKRASELEDTKAAWIARRTKALTTSKCGPRIAEARARREANQRFG